MPFTLTDEQDAIVSAPIGHYVISAVAGSGKTTTLAHRIHHLLNQGIPGQRILILMFNRSARVDFQRTLSHVLQSAEHTTNHGTNSWRIPDVRTFHAMGYRLYSRFIQEGFLSPFNPKILSDKEQDFQLWRLLNQLLSGEQLQDLKRHKKDHIEISRHFIETVKSGLQAPQIVFEALDLDAKFNYLPHLFDLFEQWRKQEARISYSDMLYDTVLAIEKYPQLKHLVENKMDVILVDEYQDTNDIQHALLKYIAGNRAKISVVGDPDQTIYEFRGAKPDYIIKGFSEEFSDAGLLSLSYSFRYGHAISLLANHLISRNNQRLPVLCKSHETTPNTHICLHRSHEDAAEVSKHLLNSNPTDLKETAILVRVWSQTVSIELALLEAEIPYHIDGHLGVFHSSEIQAIRALLELSAGMFSNFSDQIKQEKFERICQFPHIGLPDYQLKQLCQVLSYSHHTFGEQLLHNIPSGIKQFQQRKLEQLAHVLSHIEHKQTASANILKYYADETSLYEGIRSLSFNHEQAEEKVRSISSIMRFVSKQGKYPADVLLLLDQLAKKAEDKHADALKISSIHRAKGLEWQHVLIPGLNKKVFPHALHPEKLTHADIESERRLLYVAMTRAKKSLHLFGPADISIQGNQVSRFEKDLNFEQCADFSRHLYTQPHDTFTLKGQKNAGTILKKYAELVSCHIEAPDPQQAAQQSVGNTPDLSHIQWKNKCVEHCLLGVGRVISEKPTAFTVEFDKGDQRTFSKEFAGRFFTLYD